MWYFSVAFVIFIYWFILFLADRETSKDHLMSWFVLILASLMWPLTVPGAIIELASKVRANNQQNEVESDNQDHQSSQMS